ncbi:adenylyltransferase/cytidyltransferase family protein [Verrucomicrobia bacterium]|nr:adenylyltransferase/cytidyltransferase family protein [Verrucomicrobiota bacterium]
MSLTNKIIDPASLSEWREDLRKQGRTLVATNGCFDILHAGHVIYLDQASSEGDVLIVAINSDQTVRQLKGANRPINIQQDRALVLSALECVGAVYIFKELDAVPFLKQVQPDVYVKGGDYTIDTINQDERVLMEAQGGRIKIIPGLEGRSTTNNLKKLNR